MKRTITLLLIVFALLSLAACSSAVQTPATTQSDKQTSEQNVPTQHIHSFGDWTVTKNATCTEAGEQERYCSCGEKQTQSIAATGHTFGEWITVKTPTCTETGTQERVCSCGEKQTQSIAATGHSFGSWVTTKEPTCTEAGEQERTCACGEKQTQPVAAKGHTFGDWTIDKQPTCTVFGKKSRKCKNCGAAEEETISATGHQWQEATCTEPKTCSICKAIEGSALGHDYKNGTCTRCNEKYGATIIMPSAGNKYSYYSYSGKLYSTCEVTKIGTPVLTQSYSLDDLSYTVKITMKSTYDSEGNNYSRAPKVGYKIYDEDNVVVYSGTIYGENIRVGETCYAVFSLRHLEAGHTYKVEFNSVG